MINKLMQIGAALFCATVITVAMVVTMLMVFP